MNLSARRTPRLFGSNLAPVLLAALLNACAGTSQKELAGADSPQMAQAITGAMAWLARELPGEYGNYAQAWTQAFEGMLHWNLLIRPAAGNHDGRQWFVASQMRSGDPAAARHQLLAFDRVDQRLILRFAPIANPEAWLSGTVGTEPAFQPGCAIPLSFGRQQLAGETRAESCRFTGNQGHEMSLRKDFAFSPDNIGIGERIDGLSNAAEGVAQTFRFQRRHWYRGWAGRREESDSRWRLSQEVRLHDNGGELTLTDAAGLPLGYRLKLAVVPWKEDQPAILRLDLIDAETGELLNYAWSDADSDSIGITTDKVQVGLRRVRPE